MDYDKFQNEWLKKSEKRYKKYVCPLLKLGVREENIIVLNCYDKKNFNKFKQIIDDSDILIIPGGNPEMLYSKVV